MAVEFAQIRVSMDKDNNIILEQPMECQDVQFISFPSHQAEAIYEAIKSVQIVKSSEL